MRELILPLLAALVLLQLPLLLLARWLGRPLRWEAVALGFVLPLLLLLPWLDGSHVMAPSNQLLEVLPGVERPRHRQRGARAEAAWRIGHRLGLDGSQRAA